MKAVLVPTINYSCADGRFLVSTRHVTVLNSRCISSSEREISAGARTEKYKCFHQLNVRKLLVVCNSPFNEKPQLHSQIIHFKIPNGTLKTISSNASSGLMVSFSAVMF
jgi:hypothetical protein